MTVSMTTEFIESELVLSEDPHLLGAGNGALGGLLLTRKDLHEGGFPGAIGAGNSVAPAFHEGGGHVLKEDTRAEAHSDVVDCNHKN